MCLFLFSFSVLCNFFHWLVHLSLSFFHTRARCAHSSLHLRRKEIHRWTRVSSFLQTRRDILNHFLLVLAFSISFFLFDTHTVSWLLCVDVFFLARSSSAHRHTHTHKQVVICIFMPPSLSLSLWLSSHCLLASARVFLSLSLCRWCVRGPVCTFFPSSPSSSFSFFVFYNANIMSAARPIDSRQRHALRS